MRSRKVMPPVVNARIATLRQRAEEEYRRLLYVALTRAKDQLYVCGTRKKFTDAVRGWHALVRNALEPESHRIETDGELVALEWRRRDEMWSLPLAGRAEDGLAVELELPPWIGAPVSAATPAARRVSPSSILRLGEAAERLPLALLPDQPSRRASLERGRVVHRLLQALPEHPPERRRAVGEKFLAAVAPELADEGIIDRIMAILDDPVFAPLFQPGSRPEVEIAGSVAMSGGEAVVSGRIDRLAVSPESIFIVDYKTDRQPPASIGSVPQAYLAQLATYAVILKKLYPGRPLRAALLWTETPMLMDIPEESLKALETAISAA
jgi:ATP-dependent helicase/nuclease subunit A